jgi:hypothetical protein
MLILFSIAETNHVPQITIIKTEHAELKIVIMLRSLLLGCSRKPFGGIFLSLSEGKKKPQHFHARAIVYRNSILAIIVHFYGGSNKRK